MLYTSAAAGELACGNPVGPVYVSPVVGGVR
jgi:hypothetical protein